MRRRASHALLASVAALLIAAGAFGCAPEEGSLPKGQLAGKVADNVVSAQAPALAAPLPDPNAGFAESGGASAAGASASRVPTVVAITGLGSASRIARVYVRAGERVETATPLARFDTAALFAHVAAAVASRKVAEAQIPVIEDALVDTAEGRADLADARSTALSAAGQLQETRAQLVAQLAQVRAVLAKIPPGGLPSMPPGSVPGSLPPGITPTSTPRPPSMPPGGLPDVAKLRAAERQLVAGIAKIDAGLAKARSGLGQIAEGRATIADVRERLFDLRQLVRIAADTSKVAERVARYQLSLATVRAPASGIVLEVAQVGDVFAPGATVASVRRDGPVTVTTWLDPEQAGALEALERENGRPVAVRVSGDWGSGSASGTVTRVGQRALYPPTSFATREVHLTRAVEIEITIGDNQDYPLPPGSPVDVRFTD